MTNEKFKKIGYFFFLQCLILVSCSPKPAIQIPYDLKKGLGDQYPDYVIKLNCAFKGDTLCMDAFLKYSDFYEGAAFEHGYVLTEIMIKVGDEFFSKELKKLNQNQISKVNIFITAGVDMHVNSEEILLNYPKSFKVLRNIKQ